MLAKAMYVTKDITFVTEQRGYGAWETPDTGGEIAALLDRLAHSAAGGTVREMSVILDHDTATAHGFPAELPSTPERAKNVPVLQKARAHGWHCSRVRRWMTFQRDNTPTLHIGLAHWMRQDKNPLWDNDPGAATYLMWRFQNLTGQAWHASPGVMGSQMLKALHPNNSVTWHPDYQPVPREAFRQLTRTQYTYTNHPMIDALLPGWYVHVYDTNKAYLAGAGAADLARTALIHTGPTTPFQRGIAGMWRVVVPAWNDKLLPHPMGSNRTPGDDVWVTTPTLALVQELANEKPALIEFPRILDAYTAPPITGDRKKTIPRTTRVLRQWADLIKTCLERCAHEPNELEREKLTTALKGCYQQSVNGIWKTSSSQIFREDWFYTVDALVGANLYRKIRNTMNAGGPSPLRMSDVDAVHFMSLKENPKDDPLKRFVIGDSLGAFTVKTLTADEWRGEYL